jgi:hypothetical protein
MLPWCKAILDVTLLINHFTLFLTNLKNLVELKKRLTFDEVLMNLFTI